MQYKYKYELVHVQVEWGCLSTKWNGNFSDVPITNRYLYCTRYYRVSTSTTSTVVQVLYNASSWHSQEVCCYCTMLVQLDFQTIYYVHKHRKNRFPLSITEIGRNRTNRTCSTCKSTCTCSRLGSCQWICVRKMRYSRFTWKRNTYSLYQVTHSTYKSTCATIQIGSTRLRLTNSRAVPSTRTELVFSLYCRCPKVQVSNGNSGIGKRHRKK